jgi:DNA repair photolyase
MRQIAVQPSHPGARRHYAETAAPRPPSESRKGRGATGNPANRFEAASTSPFDDGWSTIEGFADLPPLPTTLTRDASRSVISWNNSPDLGFDRAINPYRGCEHGCIYCYARPSHAYLGYSPGLDFETKLTYKPEIASLLDRELRKPGYEPKPMALGSNTDPYQPVERTLKLTRSVLEVMERFGHPVSIVTKSAGVLRDMDILQRLAARGLVRVWLSITTLDATLARCMEPRAGSPERRLAAVAALTQAGVPAGVLAAPMIPGLNDAELERILERSSRAGARHPGYVLLRLPHELRQMFESWLAEHYPERAAHVLSLVRQTRAGALNDSRFHERFRGEGPYADLLSQRFARAARQWGFEDRAPLETRHFSVPNAAVAAAPQLSLF